MALSVLLLLDIMLDIIKPSRIEILFECEKLFLSSRANMGILASTAPWWSFPLTARVCDSDRDVMSSDSELQAERR